ncbi:MAG: molybdopterin-dependent oxidoreductase [Myxococcota bacterium]|jgi:isoquinoline 1-oxidoreductase beta subunit|nr:molybdopterin-dependent oxidoreductase [Myxococcota bacterium]
MSEPTPRIVNLSRRGFLAGSAGAAGGLLLGCLLPASARANNEAVGHTGSPIALGPWLQIDPAGQTTVWVEKAEMGQGVHTAMAMLVAEELDVPWEDVRVEPRPLTDQPYAVATGVSSSVRFGWQPLREAGATAREMLRRAGAEQWEVAIETCEARAGVVTHRDTGRSLPYAALAERAATLATPEDVELKPASDFQLLGTPVPRSDIPAKVTGEAEFGIDVQIEGMLYAAPTLCPYPGGTLESADREAAKRVSGVKAIVDVPNGLLVVADHWWQARKGVEALAARYSGDLTLDSDAYSGALEEALESPGVLAHEAGKSFEHGAPVDVEAHYEVPFLAHAAMEPQNCTAQVADGRCTLWAPTQAPSRIRKHVARTLGIAQKNVTVHTTFMGGAFGRRNEFDDAVQAALASRAVGRPVKVLWTREDDTRNDFYRPACAAHLSAQLDERGRPTAVRHHVAGAWHGPREIPAWIRKGVAWAQKKLQAPLVGEAWPDAIERKFPNLMRVGVEWLVAGEVPPFQYDIANQRLEYSLVDIELRLGWWRSVSGSQGAFFVESFIDECAVAAGRDPVAYRRALLPERDVAVLDRAAAMAGWDEARAAGRALGVAIFHLFGTTVCQVVEVEARGDAVPRAVNVWCALDCGQVVNPDTVVAQMEGSILFGLNAALQGKITLREGRVTQSNFHDYPLLALRDAPAIEVSILPSMREPGGIGEPGTPPIAPALTNAIFAATGRRIRKLPVGKAFLQQRAAASADGAGMAGFNPPQRQ